MYTIPRIQKFLPQEERDKIVKLNSYKSIYISWEEVAVFLDPKSSTFIKDSKVLNNLGFFKVMDTDSKFIKY